MIEAHSLAERLLAAILIPASIAAMFAIMHLGTPLGRETTRRRLRAWRGWLSPTNRRRARRYRR